MIPSRPYLLRAIFDWLVDNSMTPYIMVDAEIEGVSVPMQFVDDGRIILNIAPSATTDLAIENSALYFSAKFGGTPYNIYIPMVALLAIYSKETGQGTLFKEEEGLDVASNKPLPPKPKKKNRPTLKIVK